MEETKADLVNQVLDEKSIEYYRLLSKNFPTDKEVCTEIINLESILNLPKGTEHYMSDLHGEYEAYKHISNNCSGVIRTKINMYFTDTLTNEERRELATLIYYPAQKIAKLKIENKLNEEWYKNSINRMIILIKKLSLKYTRSKVRKAIPKEYVYIIEELINERDHDSDCQRIYQSNIIDSIISVQLSEDFIVMLTDLIKKLAVDKLHIAGDIFDRGQHPDKIIDILKHHHNVDIQWGNHDILWMGAACGNEACVARVIRNCLCYNTTEVLENSYAISLRTFERYARKKYPNLKRKVAMRRCISIMLLKIEGSLILKHPEYEMDDLLKLHLIKDNKINLDGKVFTFENLFTDDCNYILSLEEQAIMEKFVHEFKNSEKLNEHVKFLYDKGRMYLSTNDSLLYHGCMPLNETGDFAGVSIDNKMYYGKELFEKCDRKARDAYFRCNKNSIDFMFYLWSGYNSPLCGRKLKTFERIFFEEPNLWIEKHNPYYDFYDNVECCDLILKEFGMNPENAHIINGHTPVKLDESPIKAKGKVIIIDGGFCKSYQQETGIAGYTLVSNSHGISIISHTPFKGIDEVLKKNSDIHSTTVLLESYKERKLVKDTDIGEDIETKIIHLRKLLYCYRKGIIFCE